MKNEEELESIIRQKNFASLTEEERALVLRSIGSEEEYEAIRKIELAMSDPGLRSNLQPDAKTLRVLNDRMKKQQAAFDWRTIFQIKVPAYAAVLGIILISIVTYTVRPAATVQYVTQEKIGVPAIRIDTVFVTKTDTIIRSRIVYRQVNVATSPPALDSATRVHQKQTTGSGVSMKEKEELNKLLVSGSD
jgi:hypothetical protein